MFNTTLALNSNQNYSLLNNLDFNYFNQNLSYDNMASNLYKNTSGFGYLNGENGEPSIFRSFSNDSNDKSNRIDVLTNIKQEKESRNVLNCEFCNKVTQRNHFKGRFCSKICIGRFAVKTARLKRDEKFRQKELHFQTHNTFLDKIDGKLTTGLESHILETKKADNSIENSQKNNKKQKYVAIKPKIVEQLPVDSLKNKPKKPTNNLEKSIKQEPNDIEVNSKCVKQLDDFEKNSSPKSYVTNTGKLVVFDSLKYLNETNSKQVPAEFFKKAFPQNKNNFKVGMLLEGNDPKNPSLICVLSVSEIQGHRIRLHFEGYDTCYDFWRNADSQFIYPPGYCDTNGIKIIPPYGLDIEDGTFAWSNYLIGKVAAPPSLFVPHYNFPNNQQKSDRIVEIGMKLEACDKHNPFFIRICTIVDKTDTKLKLHFDGWKDDYDFWVENDSEEIHPITWCEKTGHRLEMPFLVKVEPQSENEINCPTIGCLGVGHVKGSNFLTHRSESGCPYALKNINKELLPNRLTSVPNVNIIKPVKKYRKEIFKNKEAFLSKPNQNELWIKNENNVYMMETLKENETVNTINLNCNVKINAANHNSKNVSIKRGRPKKLILGKQAENDFHLSKKKKMNKEHTDLVKMQVEEIKKNVLRFEDEIRDSVYLAKYFENEDTLTKFNLKFNSQLCIGMEHVLSSKNNVELWTIEEVSQFIKSIPGCSKLNGLFEKEQIDGEALFLMKQSDLIKTPMRIKLGPAVKIFNYISKLKNTPTCNC